MRDLTAHVTSCLLQFPDVTIQALGEDEITLDCVLHGKFTGGRSGLACLACGPQLEIVSPVTGERLSAYRFNGVNEQLPTILAVKEFSWQKRNGLLIGLEETEGSVLCLYDLGISRVVKAVVLPGRVTAIEPIINHGGASLTTQHLHQCLRWLFGVAVVVTDVGHVLLIDLCLDDLSCNQNEIEASDLEVITGIPSEIPQVREAVIRNGRHLCFQLLNPSGTAVTTLSYIKRSNQLVVGFSDGYLSLWNMKSLKKEYHFQLEGGRVPVYAVTFQEPENDPRNCCYLWAVQSTQESEGDILSLHLLQLAFSDRRRLASGQIIYEGLEYCEERYSLDLTGGVSSLRGQPSNIKLIGCQTIEKFRSHVDREDSINEECGIDVCRLIEKKVKALKRKQKKDKKEAKKTAKKSGENNPGFEDVEMDANSQEPEEGIVDTEINGTVMAWDPPSHHQPQSCGKPSLNSLGLEKPSIHSIILDFSSVTFVDTVSIKTLKNIFKDFQEIEVDVFLAGCHGTVITQLERGNFFNETITKNHLFASVHDAITYIARNQKQSMPHTDNVDYSTNM